jgi:hypothetical protein
MGSAEEHFWNRCSLRVCGTFTVVPYCQEQGSIWDAGLRYTVFYTTVADGEAQSHHNYTEEINNDREIIGLSS